MISVLSAPGKYIQGNGAIKYLPEYIGQTDKQVAVIGDGFVLQLLGRDIEFAFNEKGYHLNFLRHDGESTRAEAERLSEQIRQCGCTWVVGIGGGKTIDSAKLVAAICMIPLIIVPTVASSDAPCSSISVVYDKEGRFEEAVKLNKSPDIVLVDTGIISRAPVRMLIAGIGDAFATYYEARACRRSGTVNFNGGVATAAGYELARLCNDILLKFGEEAKNSVAEKRWSEALDRVVEACIFLSGVGFENNGCALAHAVYNGLTKVFHHFPALHGEAVAYGAYLQLLIEKVDRREMEEVRTFYQKIGLPMSLRELGISQTDALTIRKMAEAIYNVKHTKNMPLEVTVEELEAVLEKTKG